MKGSDGDEVKFPSRMEGYKEQEVDPPLPPLTARHIFDWLMEVGPTESGGMGPVPIGWTTIRNWRDATFTRLSAWEARLLRRLSTEFLTESHLAEDRYRPAPWLPGRTEVDRVAEERQLRAVLG